MKGRTGFIIGVGLGYVIGAKAGRARYDQIKAAVEKAREQPQVRGAIRTTSELTSGSRKKSKAILGDQLRSAGELLRKRTETAAKQNGH